MWMWDHFVRSVAATSFEYPWMKEVMVAQAILESGRGTSVLAREHCNWNGQKFRDSLAHLGGKKVRYETPSEPVREDGKRWDWFFQFPTCKSAIDTWCAFWFRTENAWTPYPKVRARDADVLKCAESFLTYVGPIYCPFFHDTHDESYASHIITHLLPEAEALLKNATTATDNNPDHTVAMKRVLLDPGHSTRHPGATGVDPSIHEEDYNQLQANTIRERLEGRIVCDIYNPIEDDLWDIGARAKELRHVHFSSP